MTFSSKALALLLLADVVLSVGCYRYKPVQSQTAWIEENKARAEYEHILKSGGHANKNGDVTEVLEYAAAVGEVSDAVRNEMNPGEFRQHVQSAWSLLEGVLPQVDPARRPAALRSEALLAPYMVPDWAKVEGMLRDSFATTPDWKTAKALLFVVRRCFPPSGICPQRLSAKESESSAKDVCTKMYDVGKAQNVERERIVELLRWCAQFASSPETLATTFPSVREEDWSAARETVRSENEEARRQNSGPCVFNYEQNRVMHCTFAMGGVCKGWGAPCD